MSESYKCRYTKWCAICASTITFFSFGKKEFPYGVIGCSDMLNYLSEHYQIDTNPGSEQFSFELTCEVWNISNFIMKNSGSLVSPNRIHIGPRA